MWILWVVLLQIQSVFGVMTIRARTGNNLVYHAVSATILNIIVYTQSFMFLGGALPSLATQNWQELVPIALMGTFGIVSGSLLGHVLILRGVIKE